MNLDNNTYRQSPQPVIPPPPMPRVQARRGQLPMIGTRNMRPLSLQRERTLPNWIIGSSVITFFVAFVACTFVWGYPMEMPLAVVSSISVLLFFYGSKGILNSSVRENEKIFLRNVIIIGFVVRMLWAFYGYFFFNFDHYGYVYGDDADTGWYMDFAKGITKWMQDGFPVSFGNLMQSWGSGIDDTGYPFWLSIIYLIVGVDNDVAIPFIIKCIVGAYCAKLIYNVAKRHFGDGTARMAALFVCLAPNMIYWCGTMFKEAEMMFLCCLCIDLVDRTFSSGARLSFRGLLPGVLVGMVIFFFRAPLAIVIFMAMFAHIVMASGRVMSAGKKIIAGTLVGIVLLVGMGDRLRTQAQSIVSTVQSDQQDRNMEWRSERKGGNSFAKYAGKAVFAPLIFTIPFPTFNVANERQILQQQLSGGNYIKNIMSFFVIWLMFSMLLSGEWRRHVFILAYTLGYLVTLVLSTFAQSSRFHMPIWPFLMLFAAYGIQVAKTNPKMRKWFPLVLVVEVVACLAWNWFKLKGRGMI